MYVCRRGYINCHLCMTMVGALVVVEVEVLGFSKHGKLVWFQFTKPVFVIDRFMVCGWGIKVYI